MNNFHKPGENGEDNSDMAFQRYISSFSQQQTLVQEGTISILTIAVSFLLFILHCFYSSTSQLLSATHIGVVFYYIETKKLSSGHIDLPIDDQFVFVYSTRWRREIQLSDENLTTIFVIPQKVQKIPAFGWDKLRLFHFHQHYLYSNFNYKAS